jgi:hypothetical protein
VTDAEGGGDREPHDDAEAVTDDVSDMEDDAAPEGVDTRVVGAAVCETLGDAELRTLGVGPLEGDAKFVVGIAVEEPVTESDGDVLSELDALGVDDGEILPDSDVDWVSDTVDETLDEPELEVLGVVPPEGEAKLVVGAAEVEPEIDIGSDALCELDA